MEKIIFSLAVFIASLTALTLPQTTYAKTSASSAALVTPFASKQTVEDNRAKILRDYLESRNSPLAPYAQTFVDEADKNGLDWKLVAAISGLESSFGIQIPYNSYNGWGYGVYGDNVRRFDSWEDGIAVVSVALRNDYMNKWNAKSVPEIGRLYAASPTWAIRVQYFINDIDKFTTKKPTILALSL